MFPDRVGQAMQPATRSPHPSDPPRRGSAGTDPGEQKDIQPGWGQELIEWRAELGPARDNVLLAVEDRGQPKYQEYCFGDGPA